MACTMIRRRANSLRDYHIRTGRRIGQFTHLVTYDPQNRGSEFVAALLRRAGLEVEMKMKANPFRDLQSSFHPPAWKVDSRL